MGTKTKTSKDLRPKEAHTKLMKRYKNGIRLSKVPGIIFFLNLIFGIIVIILESPMDFKTEAIELLS